VAAIVVALVCGVAAFVAGPWLLRRIPEPVLQEGESKTPYAELAGRRAALWCGGLAAAAGAVIAGRIGWAPQLPALAVLAVAGAVLGYVDVRTRFLPSAIIWPVYGIVGVLAAAGLALDRDWNGLLRAAICAVVTFGVFYLLWRIYPGGVGFGDVRLSGLLGGALGTLGWGETVAGVYGGFVLGAVIGGVMTGFKLKQKFAFGPFMLAGAVAGVLVGDWLARAYTG
jgi:leader peptidase (prepilin peptidase) / N-methyltransferase